MRRALALLLALAPGAGRAERIQQGNLVASLQGGVSPLTLPRDRPAPVSIHLAGSLRTADGSALPRVTAMEFGLAGRSGINARGPPVCPLARLRNTRDREALAACRDSVVGHGRIEVQARVPGQPPFEVAARLLVFNGRTREGRTALLLHAYASNRPVSVAIPFTLRHRDAAFGTELIARGLARQPSVTSFSMTLGRRFYHRGSWHSYLRASCPLPPRFSSGLLSLARLEFKVQGGRHVGLEIVRTCRARRGGAT